MQDYRRLRVWQYSREILLAVYEVTRRFPREEKFILVTQMRRAALSIPSNIAEGCGRSGQKELSRFLKISRGSAFELEAQLHLAVDLELLDEDHSIFDQVNKLSRSFTALIGEVPRS